ncbi:MAG: L,D-transpeptidase family protein [Sulfurovum sp.]|nr:L,D-transpeptidase family protein [Sulfurovum sp.]
MKENVKLLLVLLGLWGMTIQTLSAKSTPTFHDVGSTVMLDSLQTLPQKHFLKKLYSQLFFVPVWVQENGLSHFSNDLFLEIENDKTLSDDVKLKENALSLKQKAKELYAHYTPVKGKIALEFEVAKLYKTYMEYRIYGSINWGAFQARMYNLRAEGIKAEWVTYKPEYNPIKVLTQAVALGSLKEMFERSSPKAYHYQALKKSLEKYLALEDDGGWDHLALSGRLKVGRSYSVVPALRRRLALSGDLVYCDGDEGSVYDKCLQKSVIHFQKRHGLVAKGVIGKNTIAALNVPLSERIKQIRLNLDRIKWLHVRKNKRHITINIPSYTLYFEEEGSLIQQMRVITGKRKNPTPIFSNTVKTIVLNPHWNLPKSIIQKEMIPQLMRNPNAMARQGIEIYTGWGADAQRISGGSVSWGQYRYSKTMPYRFAQVPGYKNALGKVKFLFPNQFSVYMHDTPSKHLFKKNVRAFSHGCIRLQKPRELLKTFSTFNKNVDFEKSQKRLKGKNKAYLNLDQKVPVDVTYLTAYVDYEGLLQFRPDIYAYDEMQYQAYRSW